MEYFTLFRLATYNPQRAQDIGYYVEKPNSANSPRQHVVLRNPKSPHVARIQPVRPMKGEEFYLRTLLTNRPVASFLDARTVGRHVFPTFQEAASAAGRFNTRYTRVVLVQCSVTPALHASCLSIWESRKIGLLRRTKSGDVDSLFRSFVKCKMRRGACASPSGHNGTCMHLHRGRHYINLSQCHGREADGTRAA